MKPHGSCEIIKLNCFLGANELAVQKAKTEITRLIKEELIRLVSGTFRESSVLSCVNITSDS